MSHSDSYSNVEIQVDYLGSYQDQDSFKVQIGGCIAYINKEDFERLATRCDQELYHYRITKNPEQEYQKLFD